MALRQSNACIRPYATRPDAKNHLNSCSSRVEVQVKNDVRDTTSTFAQYSYGACRVANIIYRKMLVFTYNYHCHLTLHLIIYMCFMFVWLVCCVCVCVLYNFPELDSTPFFYKNYITQT